MINKVRSQIPFEEFDYQMLLHILKDYSCPRDKISAFLRKGMIVRIKKGLYIFGKDYRRRPYSRELLANLIYGPSYISLEYALAYYGLIPERVEHLTSVTSGRSKRFSTPVGVFSYRAIPIDAFRTGMDKIELENGSSFLMATPEKALSDKIQSDREISIKNEKELYGYLEYDLRIDVSSLHNLKISHLNDIAKSYKSRKMQLLAELIKNLNK